MTAVTRRWMAGALVVVLALAAAVVLVGLPADERSEAGPQPTLPIPTQTTTPTPSPPRDPCLGGADRPFAPRTISFDGKSYPVMKLPRDARGVPGTPPLTETGKWSFGWDGPAEPARGRPAGPRHRQRAHLPRRIRAGEPVPRPPQRR